MTIGGMAKGSGMIHPNMCTMLAFITTDAVISKETLQKALSEDVDDTYNICLLYTSKYRLVMGRRSPVAWAGIVWQVLRLVG